MTYPQDASYHRALCVADRQFIDWVRRHATRQQLLSIRADLSTPGWKVAAVERALQRGDARAWQAVP